MRVFLDSCVILSRIPRELMFKAAKTGEIMLFYSQSVEEESLHVAARKNMLPDIAASFVDLTLFGERVLGTEHDGIWLPDENDRHVVLGAIAAKAEIIATENLRDFPRAALEPLGLVAKTPDQILFPLVAEGKISVENYELSALKRAKLYKTAKSVPK